MNLFLKICDLHKLITAIFMYNYTNNNLPSNFVNYFQKKKQNKTKQKQNKTNKQKTSVQNKTKQTNKKQKTKQQKTNKQTKQNKTKKQKKKNAAIHKYGPHTVHMFRPVFFSSD